MKNFFKSVSVFGVALLFVQACAEPSEETRLEAPVVSYAIEDEDFAVLVGETVTFEAEITNSVVAVCHWYVDGVRQAEALAFSWPFDALGTYQVSFVAENEAGKTERTYIVTVNGEPLDVTYSLEETLVYTLIGDPLQIDVTVTGGDKGTVHEWKLEGEVVSETTSFARIFDTPGVYTLVYHGENEDGMSASRTWTVNVEERPLEVTWMPSASEISVYAGHDVTVTAAVVNGASGLVQTWRLEGELVSETASFTKTFDTPGTYTLTYLAVNAKEETVTMTWTIMVTEKPEFQGFMFEDYEDMTEIPAYYTGNANALSIVDNPYPSAVNPSAKVLKDDLTSYSTPTSGYVQINFTDSKKFYQAAREGYSTLHVKIYASTNDIYVHMQELVNNRRRLPSKVNGQPFDAKNPDAALWKSLFKANAWNELEFNLTDCGYSHTTFRDIQKLQLRPLSDIDGEYVVIDKKFMIVYFDDISFTE